MDIASPSGKPEAGISSKKAEAFLASSGKVNTKNIILKLIKTTRFIKS